LNAETSAKNASCARSSGEKPLFFRDNAQAILRTLGASFVTSDAMPIFASLKDLISKETRSVPNRKTFEPLENCDLSR
jgi:hypothetical protein